LFTIFLTKGITANEVGKATIKPMKNAHIHIRKKFEANPEFMIVIVKDIVKDMATDIKALNITIEYFLLSLISINHSTKIL